MRLIRVSVAVLLASLLAFSSVPAGVPAAAAAPAAAPLRAVGVIAKPHSAFSAALAQLFAGGAGRRLSDGTSLVYATPQGEAVEEYARRLRVTGCFEYVEPNYLREVTAYTSTPNDPDFAEATTYSTGGYNIAHMRSWGLRGSGSSNFDQVWPSLANDGGTVAYHARTTPDAVPVAVIDTGFYMTQADKGNIVAMRDFFATFNGATGVRTTDSDVTPVSASAPENDESTAAHGTICASEIAERANNAAAILGAAYDAKVLVYKVQGVWTDGDPANGYPAGSAVIMDSAIIDAIRDAADSGAKVISMSLGGPAYSRAMQDAIDYAYGKGVLVVAAAGNTGTSGVLYPGANNHVLCVGAYTLTGGNPAVTPTRASFSTTGTGLDIMAPGTGIWGAHRPGYDADGSGTIARPGYTFWSGTSMATPLTAAAASMLFRLVPNLTPAEVEMFLESSATDMGTAGYDTTNGYGKMDVLSAYNRVKATYPLLAKPTVTGTVTGTSIALSWSASAGYAVSYVVTGDWTVTPLYSGTGRACTLTAVPAGSHTVKVTPASTRNWADSTGVGSAVFVSAGNAPAAPTRVSSLQVATPSAVVTWTPVTGATAYDVSLNGATPVRTTGTSYALTSLRPYANSIGVRAVNAAGEASAYTFGTITYKKPTPAVPVVAALPTTVTAVPVLISWAAAADAEGYQVSVNGGSAIATTGLSASVTGLASGANTITVRATNFSGSSAWMAVPVAYTPPAKLPSSLTIQTSTGVSAIGKTFVLSGSASPTPDMIGLLMYVQVKKPGSSYWTYSSNRIVYKGAAGKAVWWYRYYLDPKKVASGLVRRGTYQFRAAYSGEVYLPAFSRVIPVVVR